MKKHYFQFAIILVYVSYDIVNCHFDVIKAFNITNKSILSINALDILIYKENYEITKIVLDDS